MGDPLEALASLLLDPYRVLVKVLNVDMDPLVLAHTIWVMLLVIALVLRLLKFRRASKAIAVVALILSLPPSLATIIMAINKLNTMF